MMLADEAEARGDASGALEVMNAFMIGPDGQPFWRPWRMKYLLQLANLADILPSWVTSRWICIQALNVLHERNRGRIRRAFDACSELRGQFDPPPVADEAEAHIHVTDRSWAYRQLFLYELGGLEFFVRRVASSALLAGADSIEEWHRASMGGYELVESASAVVTWLDLGRGTRHEVANTGCALLMRPGDHVIGRLVPIEGGVMFESQPLPVPRHVAQTVAERPADWLEALRAALASEEDEIFTVSRHRDSVVSDVPSLLWQGVLLDDGVLPDDPDDDGFTVPLARAVLAAGARELRETGFGDDVDVWACLGAALLEPYVVAALPDVVRPADLQTFERLGCLLAEPAATLCREAAQELFDAA